MATVAGGSAAAGAARAARGEGERGGRRRGGERVGRADVVAMGMRERDPRDRLPDLAGGGEDRVLAAGEQRVDEREPVVLDDEEGVDRAEAREADEVRGVADDLHGAARSYCRSRIS